MQRKFLTNLGLLLFLNLLIKPFWIFGIDRTVQNTVGASEFGLYFIVFNFSFLLNILLDLGITNFNNRNIAQNKQLLNKHFSGIIVVKFMLGIVYSIVAVVIAVLLGFTKEHFRLLGWLILNQFLISLILYLRSNISGLLMFRTDSFLSVLDRVLMILFCSLLLWGNITSSPFRIEWFVYSQTAAYLITTMAALFIVIKKAKFKRFTWNWPFTMMIIRQSLPFALMVLLMTLYNRLDPVMLGSLLDPETGKQQAGIYASGYRLLDAATMIGYLFAVLLIPIFSRMLKKKESVAQMVKLSYTLLITVAIIVAIGSFMYSYQLMELLYDDHIRQSADVFRLLMLGFVALSTSYIFGTLLTANGNLKELNLISLFGLVVNLLMNFWLIPEFLAEGSAWASLVTQSAAALAQVFLVYKIFRFRINTKSIAVLVLFILGVLALFIGSRSVPVSLPGIRDSIAWLPGFITATLLSLGLAFLLRLISLRGIKEILRGKA